MEKDPHLVLEGSLLGAYAIRAKAVYIYIRGEFVHAHAASWMRAVAEAYARNYAGDEHPRERLELRPRRPSRRGRVHLRRGDRRSCRRSRATAATRG